jgi:uncharacterized protein YuzB (UPF0349 family)
MAGLELVEAAAATGLLFALRKVTFCHSGMQHGEPLTAFISLDNERNEYVCHCFVCLDIVWSLVCARVLMGSAHSPAVFSLSNRAGRGHRGNGVCARRVFTGRH